MNKNLCTLAIAILSLGLGGAAVAQNTGGSTVQTTTGADSNTSQHGNTQNWFGELDTNKDGKLSQGEVQAGDKKGKLTDKWSDIDSNRDGSIDESEYKRFKSMHKDKNHQGTGSTLQNTDGTNRGVNQTDQR